MRLAICTPLYRTMPTRSHVSITRLLIHLAAKNIGYRYFHSDMTYLPQAREEIMREVLEEHKKKLFDWILHIDSDSVFLPMQAHVLLDDAEANNFDILSAIYFKTNDTPLPVLMKEITPSLRKKIAKAKGIKPEEIAAKYYNVHTLSGEEFFEVDVAGMGFMLVKPKVYLDIIKRFSPFPVFETWHKEGKFVGEDTVFCEKAKECRYNVMVDSNVVVGHWGKEVTIRDYANWKR